MPTTPANPMGLTAAPVPTPWTHLPNAALIDELLRDAADPQKAQRMSAQHTAVCSAGADVWRVVERAYTAARAVANARGSNIAVLHAQRAAWRAGATYTLDGSSAWGAATALIAWDQAADLVHAAPAVRNALAALDPSTYGHALTLLGPWLSVRDTTDGETR